MRPFNLYIGVGSTSECRTATLICQPASTVEVLGAYLSPKMCFRCSEEVKCAWTCTLGVFLQLVLA